MAMLWTSALIYLAGLGAAVVAAALVRLGFYIYDRRAKNG